MRVRIGLLIVLALSVIAGRSVPVAAASVAPQLDALGLPTVVIQAMDDRFMTPAAVAAGLVHIVLENTGTQPRHAILARFPDDRTIGELLAPSGDGPPAWLFETELPGFPGNVEPGETSGVVIDLTPGLYVLLDNFPGFLLVMGGDEAGATPAVPPAIKADGVIRLDEFAFRAPAGLTAGHQVFQVVNGGRQPHEIELLRSPAAITRADALQIVAAGDDAATPAGGGPSKRDLTSAGGLSWLSPGATAWIEADLDAGTYVLACWVFDPNTGMPHAMEGMIDVFTVG